MSNAPLITASGFREYDTRWRYPEQIDLAGLTALGLGFGTQIHMAGLLPTVVVGQDYRSYSPQVCAAFVQGLVAAGCTVTEVGTVLSPTAYFAQGHLDVAAVAMITASHNPNGWTGVKLGYEYPLTHGPDEMAQLRDIVLNNRGIARDGGSTRDAPTVRQAYIDDLVGDFRMSRPLRAVCACGNGTAAMYAPEVLEAIGVEIIPLHCTPDHSFPHYNPNPEAIVMLEDMSNMLQKTGADIAFGFDGDGDRCGVVDNTGQAIFADKMGLILAREWAPRHRCTSIVVDVKSTGLYATDPVLAQHGIKVDYWKTGHSHMKRRVAALNALAGFEKSGHYFINPPLGRGYDCGMRSAVEICKMLDRHPDITMSDFKDSLPLSYTTPTLSPYCADDTKYGVVDVLSARLNDLLASGGAIGADKPVSINTINGARVSFENGSMVLVRASSNTPNLVVVCESTVSTAHLRTLFTAFDRFIRQVDGIGEYDQGF